ncbi:MAG TPA: glutathione S-transferase family protein [Stellaceae bacterium]|jgi:glutathione S-transferase|nr:glutathione S-transferase family protein [Stellaceae bacterium]
MALKIYGVARSRAFRTLWMASELGLPYEHVKLDFADGSTHRPEYLAINPNGHVPSIDDDGFKLWESMAINLYLAKKYGSGAGGLYPQALEDEARVWQWSFWGMTEVERPALTALLNRIGPEDKRDDAAAEEAERALAAPLKVLDAAVSATPYLIGDRFTVADLNVAGILAWARQARVNLAAFPSVERWLKACHDRPAAQTARQLQREG